MIKAGAVSRTDVAVGAVSVLFVAMMSPPTAAAQLYECDGTWTNKPCKGTVAETLDAATGAPSNDPGRGEKRSLLHDFTMKTIKAREDYGIRVDLSPAEKACVKDPVPVEDCRRTISVMQEQLDQDVQAASVIKAREKANKLQEESNKLQRERNEIEASKPDVVVVEKRPLIVVPRNNPLVPIPHENGIGVGATGSSTGTAPTEPLGVGTKAPLATGPQTIAPSKNQLRPGPQSTPEEVHKGVR